MKETTFENNLTVLIELHRDKVYGKAVELLIEWGHTAEVTSHFSDARKRCGPMVAGIKTNANGVTVGWALAEAGRQITQEHYPMFDNDDVMNMLRQADILPHVATPTANGNGNGNGNGIVYV